MYYDDNEQSYLKEKKLQKRVENILSGKSKSDYTFKNYKKYGKIESYINYNGIPVTRFVKNSDTERGTKVIEIEHEIIDYYKFTFKKLPAIQIASSCLENIFDLHNKYIEDKSPTSFLELSRKIKQLEHIIDKFNYIQLAKILIEKKFEENFRSFLDFYKNNEKEFIQTPFISSVSYKDLNEFFDFINKVINNINYYKDDDFEM